MKGGEKMAKAKVAKKKKIEKVLRDFALILGNPDRYQIMCMLDNKNLSLVELAARLRKDRFDVSQYLRILEDGGFIKEEREIIKKPEPECGKSGITKTVFKKTNKANRIMPYMKLAVEKLVKRG